MPLSSEELNELQNFAQGGSIGEIWPTEDQRRVVEVCDELRGARVKITELQAEVERLTDIIDDREASLRIESGCGTDEDWNRLKDSGAV